MLMSLKLLYNFHRSYSGCKFLDQLIFTCHVYHAVEEGIEDLSFTTHGFQSFCIHFILCGNACGKDLLESHKYSDELCLLQKVNSKCNSLMKSTCYGCEANQSCLPACCQFPWLQPFIQAKALNSCQIELPFSALKGTHHHHACMREAAEPDS